MLNKNKYLQAFFYIINEWSFTNVVIILYYHFVLLYSNVFQRDEKEILLKLVWFFFKWGIQSSTMLLLVIIKCKWFKNRQKKSISFFFLCSRKEKRVPKQMKLKIYKECNRWCCFDRDSYIFPRFHPPNCVLRISQE